MGLPFSYRTADEYSYYAATDLTKKNDKSKNIKTTIIIEGFMQNQNNKKSILKLANFFESIRLTSLSGKHLQDITNEVYSNQYYSINQIIISNINNNKINEHKKARVVSFSAQTRISNEFFEGKVIHISFRKILSDKQEFYDLLCATYPDAFYFLELPKGFLR